MRREVVLSGPAALQIRLYRVVRFGQPPARARRRPAKWRCVAWAAAEAIVWWQERYGMMDDAEAAKEVREAIDDIDPAVARRLGAAVFGEGDGDVG